MAYVVFIAAQCMYTSAYGSYCLKFRNRGGNSQRNDYN